MITLIILGWILAQMAPPAIIWVLYGVLAMFWAINCLVKLSELASD